jgi:hypothetical protein
MVLKTKAPINTAFLYLNAPLLGGKNIFGIDCSGLPKWFTWYKLLRCITTTQEVFLKRSEPGDLAFFDNEEAESFMWASLWKTIILSMPVEKCN